MVLLAASSKLQKPYRFYSMPALCDKYNDYKMGLRHSLADAFCVEVATFIRNFVMRAALKVFLLMNRRISTETEAEAPMSLPVLR